MSDLDDLAYRRRLAELVKRDELARGHGLDRYNLPPVAKGWVRGVITNPRNSEGACQFGTLMIVEFDLVADPEQPPVPVRMSGTEFSHRVLAGDVIDIRDPTPSARPLTPERYVVANASPPFEVIAYYPGRGVPPARVGTLLGWLAVGGPGIALMLCLAALHFVFRVF